MRDVKVPLELVFKTLLFIRSSSITSESEELMRKLYEMAGPVNKEDIIEFSREREDDFEYISPQGVRRILKEWVEKHGED